MLTRRCPVECREDELGGLAAVDDHRVAGFEDVAIELAELIRRTAVAAVDTFAVGDHEPGAGAVGVWFRSSCERRRTHRGTPFPASRECRARSPCHPRAARSPSGTRAGSRFGCRHRRVIDRTDISRGAIRDRRDPLPTIGGGHEVGVGHEDLGSALRSAALHAEHRYSPGALDPCRSGSPADQVAGPRRTLPSRTRPPTADTRRPHRHRATRSL